MAKSLKKLQEQFQLLVGENFAVTIEGLVNFTGTEFRQALLTVRPTTVSEIQKVVRAAASLQLRIRAIGNAFSASPYYPDDGQVACYLDQLQRHDGPRIELFRNLENPLECELTVLSSVTVEELIEFQLHHGVELLGNVTCRSATIGGIINNGSHGTGLHCKAVCDLVVRLRLVDANGDIRVIDDEETLNATRGCLGLFGITYDVTFRVTPLSIVQVEDRWLPAEKVFYEKDFLSALIHNNVSIELYWVVMNSIGRLKRMQTVLKRRLVGNMWEPSRDEVYVRTVNRPPGPAEVNTEEWFEKRESPVDRVYKSKHWIGLKVPASLPMTSHKLVTEWKDDFMGTLIQTVPHAIHYFANQEYFPVWNMEFSFNMDSECTNVQFAVKEAIEMILVAAEHGHFPVIKLCVRFTGASDCYLSPAYAGNTARGGSGNTCHIEIESLPGTEGWHEFAAELAARWMQIPGARPDWSKQWYFIPGVMEHLKETCATELNAIKATLEASGNPRVFFTEALVELLYGEATPKQVPAQVEVPQALPKIQGGGTVNGHTAAAWIPVNPNVASQQQQVVQVIQKPVVQQQAQPQVSQQAPGFFGGGQPQVIAAPTANQQPVSQQAAGFFGGGQPQVIAAPTANQQPVAYTTEQPPGITCKKKKKKWWQGRRKDDEWECSQDQPQIITNANPVVAIPQSQPQQQRIVVVPTKSQVLASAPTNGQQPQHQIIKPEKVVLYHPKQQQQQQQQPKIQVQVVPNGGLPQGGQQQQMIYLNGQGQQQSLPRSNGAVFTARR